jgi:Uma2 family endonuclease
MSSLAPTLIGEEEFLSLAESTQKLELIDGEVLLAPSPSYRHQRMLRRVVRALEDWAAAQESSVSIGIAPLDVRFAPGRILQPDAFLVFGELPSDQEGPIDRIPDLCIEVLSANRSYDRMTKRLVYAEAGVRELWTIEADGNVERWGGARLSESEILRDQLVSPLLPGFVLELDEHRR